MKHIQQIATHVKKYNIYIYIHIYIHRFSVLVLGIQGAGMNIHIFFT
jgi:hypothetical protein